MGRDYIFGADYSSEIMEDPSLFNEISSKARIIINQNNGRIASAHLTRKLPGEILKREIIRIFKTPEELFYTYGKLREAGIEFGERWMYHPSKHRDKGKLTKIWV